jgi:pullulanase
MLRSKSLDRDSYNSGDWFNRLDFSYETNNWAVGLPPKNKNGFKWSIMRELLGDPSLKPTKMHILAAVENLKELLQIRFSSPLFHLTTANAIQARLRFHNTGPGSIPGVIIYSIEDGTEGKPGLMQLDFKFRQVVVLINARPTKLVTEIDTLRHLSLTLHSIQVCIYFIHAHTDE